MEILMVAVGTALAVALALDVGTPQTGYGYGSGYSCGHLSQTLAMATVAWLSFILPQEMQFLLLLETTARASFAAEVTRGNLF